MKLINLTRYKSIKLERNTSYCLNLQHKLFIQIKIPFANI